MNERTHDHLDDSTLAALADGHLAGAGREDAEVHLAACAACREALGDIVVVIEEGGASAAPGLADRIRAGLPTQAPRPQGGVMHRFRVPLAAAALLLVAFGLSSLWLGKDRTPEPFVLPGLDLPDAQPALQADVAPPPPAAKLGGDARFLAHVSTDKPLYKPGETLYARATVLDAFTHAPVKGETEGRGSGLMTLTSARGEIIAQAGTQLEHGVAAFSYTVPEGQAGGAYTLTAAFPYLGTPIATAEIDIRAYRAPRLRTDLQFLRKAYGPGDTVRASLESVRAEGGASAGAQVTAIARVDDVEVFRGALVLDAQGRGGVQFELPQDLQAGVGTLALRIADGGIVETAAKTLPIVLRRVELEFRPEGGDLVAGLPCGLYFEARNTRGEPADVKGRIVDETGTEVATFASEHEGRGRCVFTPLAGRTYRAQVTEPAGIEDPVLLPVVASNGFALRAPAVTYAPGKPVRVVLASTAETTATVGLYVRERELARQPVRLSAREPVVVTLLPAEAASGVLRVTVFDRLGTPRAERLIFRQPEHQLKIAVTPSAASTVPGGKLQFDVRTTDEQGRPVSAVVGLAATDDAVLSMIDPRERAPRLDAQALLGAEVAELKDAASYLDGTPEGAARTDLLLGTQGWRRFCFYDVEAFLKTHGEQGRLALAQAQPVALTRGGDAIWGEAFDVPGAPMDAPVMEGAPAPMADAGPGEADDGAGAPDVQKDEEVEEVEDEEIVVAGDAGKRMKRRNAKPGMAEPRPAGFVAREEAMPMAVREFAHKAAPDRKPGERSDFTETVYWHAGLQTDAQGRAIVEFDAADAITTIRLRADGFTPTGALGIAESTVEVVRPFYVEPKFPLEVSAGDRIDLPLVLVNATTADLPVAMAVVLGEGLRLVEAEFPATPVPAGASARRVVKLGVGTFRGPSTVRVRVVAGPYSDEVVREIKVVPAGFPIEASFGGVLEGSAEHEITLPDSVLPGSATTETAVYPTPLASMTEALERLLQEPSGCFEQTSSTNYPNVMALQYMQSHQGVDPRVVAKATAMLDRGYQRLVSFECKQKGYEWFGGDPGHEALTAYGVLEFHDMAQVMQVDGDMVKRTRTWLLARRDGKGGFVRNARALDSFGSAPQEITNAYILWSLLETGTPDLEVEIAALEKAAGESKDSYLMALAANALWLADRKEVAGRLLARLAQAQTKGGDVAGATTSITRSGGTSLAVETTSLALLAWLRTDEHDAQVERAMQWLAAQCQGGRFGATQSTILALKAINVYDAKRAAVKAPGTVRLLLDGQPIADVPFGAGQQGPIRLPDLAEKLTPGTHTVRLEMIGGGAMPYAFTLRYSAMTPASAANAPVRVTTALGTQKTTEGEPVEVRVHLESMSAEGQPMAVAIIGLPGGLEARAEQLKELVREKQVDFVETRGRDVVLYWRALAPSAKHDLTLSCIAVVPGTYEGPASRAYLYYTDELKDWAAGLKLEITAK